MSDAIGDFFADALVAAIEVAITVAIEYAVNAAIASLTDDDTSGPEAAKTNVRQPRPLSRKGIGRCRVSGAAVLRRATKNFYAQVFAYPEGPVASYGRAWLNDDEVKIVTNVVQSTGGGRYETGRAKVYERFGDASQTAYSELIAVPAFGWSAAHRGDGVPSNALICEHGKSVDARRQFPAGPLTEITREATYRAYDWRDIAQDRDDPDTWEPSANPVVWFVNNEWRRFGADWDRRFAPVLDLLTVEADICDEPIVQRIGWAQTTQAQPAGDDAMALTSVDGLQVGSTLTVAGQEVTVTSIVGLTIHFTPDLSSTVPIFAPVRWINATTITAPRYEVGFWYTSDTPKKQVREWLRQSMDGWFGYRRDGAMIIRAGAYQAPTVIFGETEIIDYSFVPDSLPGEENNVYTLSFEDPAAGYARSDIDPWVNQDDVDATGSENPSDMARKGVQSVSQARRLAKAAMDRAFSARVTVRTPMSARRGRGERYIGIRTPEEEDLHDAVFEVTEPPRLELSTASIVWTGRLVSGATRYAWNPATEEGAGPVAGYTTQPEELAAPEIAGVEVFSEYAGASRTYRLRIEITNPDPDRDDLTWFYRWRVQGAVAWVERPGGDIDPMVGIILETDFVPSESLLDVQVAYQTGGGSQSDWSETALADTNADFLMTEDGDVLATEGDDPILTED